jgi:uncharacterized protein with PQ loop repeat
MSLWDVLGGFGGILGLFALILTFPKVQKSLSTVKIQHAINVNFSFFSWFSEGILLGFSQHQPLSYYQDNNLIAFNNPSMFISVSSNSNSHWVKIAPFFIVSVKSKIKLDNEAKVYVDLQEGKGGGGMPRQIAAVFLGDSPKCFKAAYLGDEFSIYSYLSNNVVLPDVYSISQYFTLEPNEVEEFNLDIVMEPGYVFEFSIGVPYIYRGTTSIKWSDEYKIGRAKTAELWTIKGIRFFSQDEEWGEYPDNYKDVGLVPVSKQNYKDQSFDSEKIKLLYKALQKSPSRDFNINEDT